MVFKYTFEDGTVLRLIDTSLNVEEVWKLQELHGMCKVCVEGIYKVESER